MIDTQHRHRQRVFTVDNTGGARYFLYRAYCCCMQCIVAGTGLYCGVAHAQVVADMQANADKKPVVVPMVHRQSPVLVQIQKPNAQGISHNQYHQFNVQKAGVVLMNNPQKTSTRLAGTISANPLLHATHAARLILNEVTGNHVSVLQGPIEVAGKRADVVIGNPNGITVNGLQMFHIHQGFVTTDKPLLGASGSLSAWRLSIGKVQEGSTVMGSKIYHDALAHGVDAAALGGMYAHKIQLAATPQGMGVAHDNSMHATVMGNGRVVVTKRDVPQRPASIDGAYEMDDPEMPPLEEMPPSPVLPLSSEDSASQEGSPPQASSHDFWDVASDVDPTEMPRPPLASNQTDTDGAGPSGWHSTTMNVADIPLPPPLNPALIPLPPGAPPQDNTGDFHAHPDLR